jgi:hypothetical protein
LGFRHRLSCHEVPWPVFFIKALSLAAIEPPILTAPSGLITSYFAPTFFPFFAPTIFEKTDIFGCRSSRAFLFAGCSPGCRKKAMLNARCKGISGRPATARHLTGSRS